MSFHDALNNRPMPEWFTAASFGCFVHFGVYSVPGFSTTDSTLSMNVNNAEWYYKKLTKPSVDDGVTLAHHQKKYEKKRGKFDYWDFAATWTAKDFDANELCRKFKAAGAEYVVFTAKHHDGFCLFPTQHATDNRDVRITKHQRDLVREMKDACVAHDLRFGVFFSLMEWNQDYYRAKANAVRNTHSDNNNNKFKYVPYNEQEGEEEEEVDDFMQRKNLQLRQLVEDYEPDLIWFDAGWELTVEQWDIVEFIEWLYTESPVAEHVVINDRFGRAKEPATFSSFSSPTDRFQPTEPLEYAWECCMTVGTSFGHNAAQTHKHFKSFREIQAIREQVNGLGGKFLLNFGPTGEGNLVPREERVLKELAKAAAASQ